MTDISVPYPEQFAKSVLQMAVDYVDLRSEVYLQLMKQLDENPRAESVTRGWNLMCMLASTFLPATDFRPYYDICLIRLINMLLKVLLRIVHATAYDPWS